MNILEQGKNDSDSAESDEEESDDQGEAEGLLRLIRRTGGREVIDMPFEASTYDGLALSAILFVDESYRKQEGVSEPSLQLIYMFVLHSCAILGQFLLVYWTYMAGLESGYDPYVQAKMDADLIEASLSHDPPVSLSKTNSTSIVEWCQADTTHPASHSIILVIWATRMVMELADATWRCHRIWVLGHAKNRLVVDWSAETPCITKLTPGLRLFLTLFLSVPQYMIAICLSWTGAKLLQSAKSMPNLVLKALTLQYIIGIDELIYTAFSSVRFKQFANGMKFVLVSEPSRAWKAWGSNSLKLLASAAYVLMTLYVFRDLRRLRYDCHVYFHIFPKERLARPHIWMFGGELPGWMSPGWL